MKIFTGILLACILPLVAGCGGGQSELQGTWKTTRMVTAGKETPDDRIRKDVTVTFEGDKMITQRKGKVLATWTYKVDATKDPKQLTITMGEPGKEKDYYEIYKVEGDTLTTCSGARDFPKEFTLNTEQGCYYTVRTRVKE